jgi:hypothetical protein
MQAKWGLLCIERECLDTRSSGMNESGCRRISVDSYSPIRKVLDDTLILHSLAPPANAILHSIVRSSLHSPRTQLVRAPKICQCRAAPWRLLKEQLLAVLGPGPFLASAGNHDMGTLVRETA